MVLKDLERLQLTRKILPNKSWTSSDCSWEFLLSAWMGFVWQHSINWVGVRHSKISVKLQRTWFRVKPRNHLGSSPIMNGVVLTSEDASAPKLGLKLAAAHINEPNGSWTKFWWDETNFTWLSSLRTLKQPGTVAVASCWRAAVLKTKSTTARGLKVNLTGSQTRSSWFLIG